MLSSLVHFCVEISGLNDCKDRGLCTWKNNSQHSQFDHRVPDVGYQESTCQSWHQDQSFSPKLNYVLCIHVFHGWYIVVVPDPGVVYYLHSWHMCDWILSLWEESLAGRKKKKEDSELFLSFNFVKVRIKATFFGITHTTKFKAIGGYTCIIILSVSKQKNVWDFSSSSSSCWLL